ncbi:MAG: NYN domain-containing protein [Synergistales bacterium]|jgi:uncharacterized protein (TIGR00288 family)
MNNSKESPEIRFAVLIDGDNAQPSLVVDVLKEVAKYGKITIRRVYGDWTSRQMETWKKHLPQNAVQPVQQFRNTVGKNATDSAMIIDAMDLLYGGNVEGFAIVSSDSDYTRLAIRLREDGKFVVGIGKMQTPEPFVRACDLFVYTENLVKPPAPPAEPKGTARKKGKSAAGKKTPQGGAAVVEETPPAKKSDRTAETRSLLSQGFDMVVQDDGWATLSDLGKALRRLDPAFDSRTYGYSQLSKMIEAHQDLYEIEREAEKGPSQIYFRRRETK